MPLCAVPGDEDGWVARFASASLAIPLLLPWLRPWPPCGCTVPRIASGRKMPHTSVDEDVIPTQLEEARDVLEHEREAVVLPIIGVIGELEGPLDV